jgi:small-conductance mechanosensitive channel
VKKLVLLICLSFLFTGAYADEPKLHEKPSQVPERIAANPETPDQVIGLRLEEIMKSTGWFKEPKVTVEEGVVFLYGETKNHQFKDWAGDLAHNTQDVTAVVNKIVVLEPSIWDVHMVAHELQDQARKILRALPAILFGGVILFLSWLAARLVYRIFPKIFRHKVNQSLVHEVFARAVSILVFLLGIYFIFEMADLTTMAITVLSGTGLIGIIVGIAFRDITENFLASVLLSVQNPFHAGDLIDIVCPTTGYAVTGYVDRLTLRVTILVLLDGNHLQIPNATVYKSNIRNYTSNPNRREDFTIAIGTNCSVSKAVEGALKVLIDNEAVLNDPEPLVLVDNLTKDAVTLHIYYWIDTRKNNWLKVKSSVIRLIKQVLQEAEVCAPTHGAPKEVSRTKSETKTHSDHGHKKIKGLSSQSRVPEGGKNLLNTKKEDLHTEDPLKL